MIAILGSAHLIAIGIAYLAGISPATQIDESWKGQKVILLQLNTRYFEMTPEGTTKPVGTLVDISYSVIDERSSRLKVSQQSIEGWINKSQAVLLKDAERHFTNVVQANPTDVTAWHARGHARYLHSNHADALADFNEAIRLESRTSRWHVSAGLALRASKRYTEALQAFETAMKLDSRDAVAFNKAAWLLATCPKVDIRDGKRAMALATKACEMTMWRRPGYIDSLAAAYAEAGRFDEAIRYQLKALEDDGYVKRHGEWASKLLEGYRKNIPYREE